MKLYSGILIVLVLLASCGKSKKKSQSPELHEKSIVGIELLWKTDTVFKTPESLIYDSVREFVYVANVNENPWEKDGNGFISRMDLDGNIISPMWVSGFNGPKGMGIVGEVLYVADIDELIEVNIITGEIVNRIAVEGAQALNDVSIGPNGEVYFTDSGDNAVYRYRDGAVDLLVSDVKERPNGILALDKQILVVFSGSHHLISIDNSDGTIREIVAGLGHADGIMETNKSGSYVISDWQGQLFYFSQESGLQNLLDTREDKINAADIWFIKDQSIILVPTFFDNRVMAYKLKE